MASWLLNVNFGMWVGCCSLWSVVCGRVPKFGARIIMPGQLDLVGLVRRKIFKWWNSSEQPIEPKWKSFLKMSGRFTSGWSLGYIFGVQTGTKALPNV